MESALVNIFIAAAGILWMSSFGYLLFLQALRLVRRRTRSSPAELPPIAVVVPTLNEEAGILEKIRDLRRTDYPADKLRWLVVDGGSRDRTADIVRAESARDGRLGLVVVPQAAGKAEQVRTILRRLDEPVVVFTDADSRLEPGCIREVVMTLLDRPGTAMAGASVNPAADLPEERLHWLFLNHIWWLEGEALSCAGLSGVCYALHRPSFPAINGEAKAEDIHLGALACARGLRVRLSRRARAVELRTPRSAGEFLRFRERRGSCYLTEILGVSYEGHRSARWRLARAVRIWQMLGLPWVAAAVVLSGGMLLATSSRILFPAALLAFGISFCAYTLALSAGSSARSGTWGPMLAVFRYLPLLFLSLIRLEKRPEFQGPRGGLVPGEGRSSRPE